MTFGNSAEWMLETEQSKPIINRAIDLGINFFDTANVYSKGRSEEIVGELLQGRRNDIVLASKVRGVMGDGVNDYGLSRYHIMKQIEGSLSRLKTDHIDLYQTHRWDYTTPIEETLTTMSDLVRNGQVRYIGASNYFAWQLSKSLWTSKKLNLEKFVSMQNHHNLCYREEEREMVPLCKNEGVGLIPYSPLARGFLTGKYSRDLSPQSVRYGTDHLLHQRFFRSEDFDVLENVIELSNQKNVSPITLFATHYHELVELAQKLPKAFNLTVKVKEMGNNVIFLRKIIFGGADKSYGIHVADMAGVPNIVVNRANHILNNLININNIEKALKISKKIDISSSLEDNPGEKSVKKVSDFLLKVKNLL